MAKSMKFWWWTLGLGTLGAIGLAVVLGRDEPETSGEDEAPPLPPGTSSRTLQLGELEVLEVITGGASPDSDLPVIVALHGRGGSPDELVEVLAPAAEPVRWLLPYGPEVLGDGYAWWQAATRSSSPALLASQIPPARGKLVEMLLAVEQQFGRRPRLVGWSQGGILAYSIAASAGYLVDQVVSIAGWLPAEAMPMPNAYESVQFPLIVGVHGRTDTAVPVELDELTLEQFELAGAEVDFRSIDGVGHDLAKLWPLARAALF